MSTKDPKFFHQIVMENTDNCFSVTRFGCHVWLIMPFPSLIDAETAV